MGVTIKGSGKIVIDGREFNPSNSLRIEADGSVIVDGCAMADKLLGSITVNVIGDVDRVDVSNGEVHVTGDAKRVSTVNGSISCRDVAGDVTSVNGSITCAKASGHVSSINGKVNR